MNNEYAVKISNDFGQLHLCVTHNGYQWSSISINEPEHEIPKIIEALSGLNEAKMQRYVITEGVEGYWHYHISQADKFTKSLCGKNTMQTNLSWGYWGVTGYLKERYCKECYDLLRLSDQNTIGATEYNSGSEGIADT